MSRAVPCHPATSPHAGRLALNSVLTSVLASVLSAGLGVACFAGGAAAQPLAAETAHRHHPSHGARMNHETVDQRISSLHGALMITADEETSWAAVAQTMRWNEAAMQKMVADRRAEAPGGGGALDDLKTYEKFNRAHLEGLKDLIASFGTLYNAMPDAQKTVADHVFKRFGRKGMNATG